MLLLFTRFCKNLKAFQAIRPMIIRELEHFINFAELPARHVLMNRNIHLFKKGHHEKTPLSFYRIDSLSDF